MSSAFQKKSKKISKLQIDKIGRNPQ